jgi:hypothetical protein
VKKLSMWLNITGGLVILAPVIILFMILILIDKFFGYGENHDRRDY